MFAGLADLQNNNAPIMTSSFSKEELKNGAVSCNTHYLSEVIFMNIVEHNQNNKTEPFVLSMQSAVESLFENLCSVLPCRPMCPTYSQMHVLSVMTKFVTGSSAEVLTKSICTVELSALKLFTNIITSIHHLNVSMVKKNFVIT
jgi:hypothetical protein